jgi:hypothetical protein
MVKTKKKQMCRINAKRAIPPHRKPRQSICVVPPEYFTVVSQLLPSEKYADLASVGFGSEDNMAVSGASPSIDFIAQTM